MKKKNIKKRITHSGTGVETDVDGASEQHEIGLGEFEGLETGRQRIAVDRVEILEQIRIHRTSLDGHTQYTKDVIRLPHFGRPIVCPVSLLTLVQLKLSNCIN